MYEMRVSALRMCWRRSMPFIILGGTVGTFAAWREEAEDALCFVLRLWYEDVPSPMELLVE